MVRVDPGLMDLIGRWIAHSADPAAPPPILGISGSQGSGKSTLARAAAEAFGAATLSLDDVYLTRAERRALAAEVHPLFAVRGPPGTHDLALLNRTLDRLRAATDGTVTSLPRFDKRADDRLPDCDWPVFAGRPTVILLEGWCLGARPQADAALDAAINALERDHDPDGLWRRAINARLAGDYAALFARLDRRLFLKAPGFEVVLDWRCEQEAGLMGLDVVPAERRAALAVFIQHYERLTRHMIDGGALVDVTVVLDETRAPVATTGRLAR